MLDIYVCACSACHVNGSYALINCLRDLICASGHADEINLMAALCLENCGRDVSIRVGESEYFSLKPSETENYFAKNIMPRIV
ncbi:MAG: (2Fe-2S) ferredoxin domain-containing protein [Clostridia bacterium]